MHQHDGHNHGNPPSEGNQPEPDKVSRVDPYAGGEQVWSGKPNQVLVDEVRDMAPRRVIDVGSGEGADAVWLAARGWRVTGLEPSPVAQRRAQAAAAAAGVTVAWVQATLLEADLPAGGFDLVTCMYPALFRSAEHNAEAALTRLVAPGGTLLVVTHADVGREFALAHGFDPDDYVDDGCIRDWLGNEWTIEAHEQRPRQIEGGAGAHHHTDLVLRALRL